MNLVSYLRKSLWNIELEHALEGFSIRTYLNWFDQHYEGTVGDYDESGDFPKKFLEYLEVKVSNPCS